MVVSTPRLAVLIDADNTSPKFTKAIFDEIATLGEASVRRCYGDFSSQQMTGWSRVQAEFGLVPHHQPANTVGKNASDIALVIDAMDLMHSGRFDGFVIVSSDSDFTRLASRIREQGLDVYGMGKKNTPAAFRAACKRFIFLENVARPEEVENGREEASENDPPSKARPLIRKAMDAIDPETDWVPLSPLGKQLNASHPDFDPRNYGCKNLSTLIKKAGQFEIKEFDGTFKVRRKTD